MRFLSKEPKPTILGYAVCTLILPFITFLCYYAFYELKLDIVEFGIALFFLGGLTLLLSVISQPIFLIRFLLMRTHDLMTFKIAKIFFILFNLCIIFLLSRSGEVLAMLLAGGISIH